MKELILEICKECSLDIEGILNNVDFNETHKCHDWKNYVQEWAREFWSQLSLETRFAIYSHCKRVADAEDWE